MRSVAPMKIAKIGYLVISIALCTLGIVMIAAPDVSASILGILCGILMLAFGLIKLIGYFSKDLYRLAFQYDLFFGALMILLGIVVLVRPGRLLDFISIAFGLYITADALFKAQIAMDSRRFGIREWWLILAFAILTGIFGVILLFRPGDGGRILMILMGITFLLEGILNLCTVITAVKIIRHQQPDRIEITTMQ